MRFAMALRHSRGSGSSHGASRLWLAGQADRPSPTSPCQSRSVDRAARSREYRKAATRILPVCVDTDHVALDTGDGIMVRIDDRKPSACRVGRSMSPDIGREFFRWEIGDGHRLLWSSGSIRSTSPTLRRPRQVLQCLFRATAECRTCLITRTEHYIVTSSAGDASGVLPFIQDDGRFVAILAYLPMTPSLEGALETLRFSLGSRYRAQATLDSGHVICIPRANITRADRQPATSCCSATQSGAILRRKTTVFRVGNMVFSS